MTAPCMCWSGPVVLHGGHCCFRDVDGDRIACGHYAAGMALHKARMAAS